MLPTWTLDQVFATSGDIFYNHGIYAVGLSRRNVKRDKGGFLASAAAVAKCHFLSLANVEYCLEKAVSARCKQPAIEYPQ